ncbi:cyclic nucleotide-binding domain-containing protein [Solirubrobacter ginsenosidimutans]|uniref:Cyclic nucleotide-binding domain-containing protein n=1 Tax=Solirubrobacter ginsenosidimutans TaxID=490573 RepID=A0A9X3N5J6_9ACTN|nr:cyclic nucleotide-binding domain-containing protein [Solirubrobacter ginsenosidimutans]MDA0165278.1 cyclic nucleotide-binding domain-containing protein [Solirubrobacter ginsenosidimutans]
MDTSGFFQYPGTAQLPTENPPGFLEDRNDEDWALLLEHTETRLFRAGQEVLTQGERDRALYLLVDGRLHAPSGPVAPVSTFGEVAFLDGRPRAVTVTATSDAEVLRLGHESFLALSARRPDLGRAVLTDISSILAARFRNASDQIAGWTG